MRFLIKFSYDGSSYYGFQRQLEEALTNINNHHKTDIVATGRTDKGVHALAQYGHVDLDVNITEKKLKRAMNSFLPDDIHVIDTKIVSDSFHTRYQVKEKTYEYILNMGEYNPLERNYVFQYNHELNVKAMEEAIIIFEGEHDFRAFVTDNKEKEKCIRTITHTSIRKENENIIFKFTGDGFLRYQVRNMVGLLIKVGENKLSKDQVKEILESKDRTKSGKTAPAEGLYLIDVKFKGGE